MKKRGLKIKPLAMVDDKTFMEEISKLLQLNELTFFLGNQMQIAPYLKNLECVDCAGLNTNISFFLLKCFASLLPITFCCNLHTYSIGYGINSMIILDN